MIWTDKKGEKHSDYYYSCASCLLCRDCKNFISMGNMFPICSAFPDGIPEDVWSGKIVHTAPVKGDHGIQYEKIEIDDTDLPELLFDED